MKNRSRIIWALALICVFGGTAAAFFLRPVPDLDFLYINYPEIKGRIPTSVIGTTVVYFLDPAFYYKFNASETEAVELARLLKLEPADSTDIFSPIFHPINLFWHDWTWWHPNPAGASKLFHAYREGNDVYLLYDFKEKIVYLYIQNT